jgi:glycosyltransferase involved in cell wall biosynthesis
MRLVFVTQTLDAEHPALGQTLDLVTALSARSDELVVLCQSVAAHPPLPKNVRVRVFGAGSRAGRGLNFAGMLAGELRRRPDALLAHMVPLYVVLAAPLAKPLRVPLALWYTHWHAGRTLRLAERLADVVLSVDARSFPLASGKVHGIGHAIDVDLFSPGPQREPGERLRLLALGRTARWKGYETMLAGLDRAVAGGVDAELEIRGPQLTDDERAHVQELRRAVASSPVLAERVRIEPPKSRAEMPELLRRADVLLSATQPRGSETIDKVVLEAAACGTPVLASNSALDGLLGDLPLELRFRARDHESLGEALAGFAAAPAGLRAEIGSELRRRVVAHHSVDSWADAVAQIVTRLGRREGLAK